MSHQPQTPGTIASRLHHCLFPNSRRRQSPLERRTVNAAAQVLEEKVLLSAFQHFDGVAAGTLPVGWVDSSSSTNHWKTYAQPAPVTGNYVGIVGIGNVGSASLTSPAVSITSASGRLSFLQRYDFDAPNFDGAVLEISIAGGAFQDIITAGGTFIAGGYNGTVSSGFSNPLANRNAWVGSTATFTTVVDVPAAAIGQIVQFRWRFGSDNSVVSTGWSIDTVDLSPIFADLDDQISEVVTPVTLNSTVTGVIDNSVDVDLYRVTVTAGQTLQFDIDTQDYVAPLTNSWLRLFNSAGAELASNNDGTGFGPNEFPTDSFIQYTFATSGTYFIGVSGLGNASYNPLTGAGDTVSFSLGAYDLHIGTAPTVSIEIPKLNFGIREHGTMPVTFKFSEPVTGFNNADLNIENGTLSAVTSTDGGMTWTATFTPTPGILDSTNVITLKNAGVTDLVGTPVGVGTTSSLNFKIDTIVDENDQLNEAGLVLLNSTTNTSLETLLDVDMYAIDVSDGQTVQIDIDFQGLANPADATVLRVFNAAGTQLALSTANVGYGAEVSNRESYIEYTFATAGRYYVGVSTYDNFKYSAKTGDGDSVVNIGGTPFFNPGSYTLHIGTAPTSTVTMSDNYLLPGETSLVTIAFTEKVVGFANSDITVQNGNLSAVTSSDGGKTWKATFTPTAGIYDTSNVITVNNAGVIDTVGTPGVGISKSPNYSIGVPFNSAQLVADPQNPGQKMLIINGTNSNDVISVTHPTSSGYTVVINNVNKGTFSSPSRIWVMGQNGNDQITLAQNVTIPSLLEGGNGNDTINGGGSNSVMLGGAGDDILIGFGALVGGANNDIIRSSGGRSVMIGGTGEDNLTSQFGEDILIGGTTNHDTNPIALAAIRKEWNSGSSVSTRISHLAGLASGGLNGSYLLVSDDVRAGTVHNDFAQDSLSNNSDFDWLLPFSGDLRSRIIGQVNHA